MAVGNPLVKDEFPTRTYKKTSVYYGDFPLPPRFPEGTSVLLFVCFSHAQEVECWMSSAK